MGIPEDTQEENSLIMHGEMRDTEHLDSDDLDLIRRKAEALQAGYDARDDDPLERGLVNYYVANVMQEEPERFLNILAERFNPQFKEKIDGIVGETKVVKVRKDRYGSKNTFKLVLHDQAFEDPEDSTSKFSEYDEYVESVLRQHAKRRPLIIGDYRELKPEIVEQIFFNIHPDFREKGVGRAFQERFEQVAREQGYRFIYIYRAGINEDEYFEESGAYIAEELDPKFRKELYEIPSVDFTDEEAWIYVKFLNPEDEAKYVKKNRIGKSAEDRDEYKDRQNNFWCIIGYLSDMLNAIVAERRIKSDASYAEESLQLALNILIRLNEHLPKEIKLEGLDIDVKSNQAIQEIRAIGQNLKSLRSVFVDQEIVTNSEMEEYQNGIYKLWDKIILSCDRSTFKHHSTGFDNETEYWLYA